MANPVKTGGAKLWVYRLLDHDRQAAEVDRAQLSLFFRHA
jgi:hypothetical protein